MSLLYHFLRICWSKPESCKIGGLLALFSYYLHGYHVSAVHKKHDQGSVLTWLLRSWSLELELIISKINSP